MSCTESYISVQNCAICNGKNILVSPFSWEFKIGQVWLVTGPNGGGKDFFVQALKNQNATFGQVYFEKQREQSSYFNSFGNSISLVSLEVAASLIEEERQNDESDYIEGGVDIGRTAEQFISEVLPPNYCFNLKGSREVELCGIKSVLNRGLKYLSTGEIRRVLLCRSLLSKSRLLILSDPFAGLDLESRTILRDFLSVMAKEPSKDTAIILCMEGLIELPEGITDVLEFTDGKVSFCSSIAEYAKTHQQRQKNNEKNKLQQKEKISQTVKEIHFERQLITNTQQKNHSKTQISQNSQELVSMHNVNVGWGGHTVLKNLTWRLYAGQHWLIRGPNGSGKTTLLELITGDNMQVFCNDVSIFGRRRGTGETVWEIKEKMGIVSYRLHLEYRMIGNTDLEAVLLSGFHDSIGLYEQRSQVEQAAVKKWLSFGGFSGREHEPFNSLSYGEQRAILILRGVVKCPTLLVLDEPCHGLDENYRNRILQLLESIADTGSTTLLHVTHDPTEVLSCEKHILELRPKEDPMYKIITQ